MNLRAIDAKVSICFATSAPRTAPRIYIHLTRAISRSIHPTNQLSNDLQGQSTRVSKYLLLLKLERLMEQRIELLAGSLLRSGAVRTVEPDTSPTSMHEFESPCRLRYTLEQRYVDTAIHALLLLGKLVVELHSFIGVWQLCRLLLPMLWRCLVLRA